MLICTLLITNEFSTPNNDFINPFVSFQLSIKCVLVYWDLTPQQQPGSYQGGEMMMMKSVFWWRKPEYPEETTDPRQVTDETFHTYGLCPVRGLNLGRSVVKQSELRRDESALAHRATAVPSVKCEKIPSYLLLPGPSGLNTSCFTHEIYKLAEPVVLLVSCHES